MTLQAANRLTAAETQLIDAYTNQIGSLPGDGAVLLKRDSLFDGLKRQGLPTRRVETFHYTDLKALLRALPADEPQAIAQGVKIVLMDNNIPDWKGRTSPTPSQGNSLHGGRRMASSRSRKRGTKNSFVIVVSSTRPYSS